MRSFFRRAPTKTRKSDYASVLDYGTTDTLRDALSGTSKKKSTKVVKKSSTRDVTNNKTPRDATSTKTSRTEDSLDVSAHSRRSNVSAPDSEIEWKTKDVDMEISEPQTMEQELQRLQVLQSYLLLDSETEEDFDRITRLASKVFNVPIALISLVDLGRQWFMSAEGLDAKETPRKFAFCAHVILTVKNIMVVPDATKDLRFKDNPLVTGPPNIRFYAGAALVSPEGYKLGTVCIIDDKPRFLKKKEQHVLKDLAAMAMSCMVDRRKRLMNEDATKAKILAHTCLDMAASLESMGSSLASVTKEIGPNLTDQQRKKVAAITSQVEIKSRICRSALRTCTHFEEKDLPRTDAVKSAMNTNSLSSSLSNLFVNFDKIAGGSDKGNTANMPEMFHNLNNVIAPLPRKVPITIELKDNVPSQIIADDLLLFRSALNLLSSSMERTNEGFIHLSILASYDQLYFECEDTGPLLLPGAQNDYFTKSHDELLTPMMSMVSSMGGEYGIRVNQSDPAKLTTIVWFSIPLMDAMDITDWGCENISEALIQHHDVKGAGATGFVAQRSKAKIVVDDPFQAALIENSCLAGALEPTIRAAK